MKAKKFDSDFDKGEDVTGALDLSKARRPLQKRRRVNVDPRLDDRVPGPGGQSP